MTKNSKNIIILSIAVLLAILFIVIAVQPSNFSVTRSTTIAAPTSLIYDQVNNLHNWEKWSPWKELEPTAKVSFEGPTEGKDAVMSWEGESSKVGKGKMTIVENNPSDLIKFRLDFQKPMEGTSTSEFTFKPNGEQTVVTWSMYGKNNFIAKAMSLVFNCEKMVREQFDKGLSNLKKVSEAAAIQVTPAAPISEPQPKPQE